MKALRFPHTHRVEPTAKNGLVIPTVFLGFQVQPVDKKILALPPIGVLSEPDLAQLESEVLEALGLGLGED